VAYLWEPSAFRALANWEAIPETANLPNLRLLAGVQGIGTGNPGYAATSEKNFAVTGGSVNVFLGIGFRSNENHGHLLGGAKFSSNGPWAVGFQNDGHRVHPFATYDIGRTTLGVYLIEMKSPGLVVSHRW
jgi:hypothetical protein